jgi:hypothetical protein
MRRDEKSVPSYLIHPIDQPRGKIVEEKPSRIPGFGVDVLAITAVFSAIVFAALYSFYKGFWPGGGTAVLTLFFFLWRVARIFDTPIAEFKETLFQDVSVKAKDGRSIPVSQNGQPVGNLPLRNPKAVRGPLGNVELSGRQLDQLLKIIDDPEGDGKYRRETSMLGRGVMDIGITTAQDPILKAALKGRGFINDEQFWTDSGRQWVAAP